MVVALGLIAGTADARGARRGAVQLQEDLTASDVMPGARGHVDLVLRKASAGKFEVVAKRLERRKTYEVVLHGIKIGSMRTSNGGNGKLRFSSRAHQRARVLGFEPRGRPLSINDSSGRPVLSGSLPDVDPDQVACCVPHDDGGDGGGDGSALDQAGGDEGGVDECESMTADECSSAGGTVADAPSCLSDPCSPSADQTIVCCLPCGDPPPCELRTEADCVADNGMVAAADTCEPNPCAPTPALVECCVPRENEGAQCELRTSQACDDDGGSDMGVGSCDPDPCS